jgi:hypothetical protein
MIARSTENDPQGNAWNLFEAPSVARVGESFDVVFRGGAGNYTGVFVDRTVTTSTLPPSTLITTQDTITVPGLGSNLDISFASQGTQPGISSGGHTVFDINVALQTKQVLLTRGPSASDLLRVVSYEGMAFTGALSGTVLVAASLRGIAPNGDVGFRARSTATTNGSGMFRWISQTAALQLVAHTNLPALGTVDLFNLIAHPTNQPYVAEFGDTGRGVFRATIKASSGSTTNTGFGIWLDDPVAGVSNVADTYTNAPGVLPQTKFGDFHAPAVNSTGVVASRGCLTAGCGDDGLWSGQPNSVSLVVRDGDLVPDENGVLTSDTFEDLSNPVLNEDDALAFRASTSGANPEGFWRRASQFGAGIRRVVRRNDLLRGTSLTFSTFGADLVIADTGELAFTATMSDGKVGLFTTFQLGSTLMIVKIAKEGEAFDFTQTQTKLIKQVFFHPGAYPMGTTGFIHVDSVQEQPQAIGFALTFDDPPQSSRALVLTTVER